MPASLTIGAFVFGAVLILLALVGGNFKVFGAEVSSTVGRSVRIISFLLGVGFVAFALLGGDVQGPMQMPTPGDDRQATAATDTRPAVADLSGRWYDNHGGIFNVRHNGSQLTFDGHNASADVSSEGSGRIDGDALIYNFSTSIPSTGTARYRLAPDRNSASGVVHDSEEGTYSSVLRR